MIAIGPRIRTLRQAAGLSQTDLARQAGLSQRAVSAIENGEIANPGVYTLDNLATALGLPLIALLAPDAGPPHGIETPPRCS
jgi:transcriptional regulator with XRE-family HTH domain